MDFYDNVGVLAIASRLRRLTDRMSASDVKIYEMFGLDFKPKWFPVFATLMDDLPHAVTSVAKYTGLSHSSVSVIAKELEKKGLAEIKPSVTDARCTELSLTDSGRAIIPSIRLMMMSGEKSVSKVLNICTQNLWIAISEWEKCLDELSLFERVKEAKEELEQLKK